MLFGIKNSDKFCVFLVHLSQRLKCTIVITCCPSVVCPSLTFHIFNFSSETAERNSRKLDRKQDHNVLYQVCVFWADRKNKIAAQATDWMRHFWLLHWNRWSVFNKTWQEARSQRPLPILCFLGRSEKQNGCHGFWLLRHFRLLWNHWMEFNETWQEARSQHPLPSLCFRANQKNKMATLASDWLTHFRLLLWNRWTKFNKTSQEARSQRPLPSLCFSGRLENRKQDFNLLYQVRVFQADLKTRWRPRLLIGWDIFNFSSETVERNATKLDRKQDLNILYQVCVFQADQ